MVRCHILVVQVKIMGKVVEKDLGRRNFRAEIMRPNFTTTPLLLRINYHSVTVPYTLSKQYN